MTDIGYALGLLARLLLLLALLGAAAYVVRRGWDRAGRRRPDRNPKGQNPPRT